MCDIESVFVESVNALAKAHKKKYPEDIIRVLQVKAPNCLVEWVVSDPAMVLRGWARAEDDPKSTKDIQWHSKVLCGNRPPAWPEFLLTTIEKTQS